MPSISLPLRLSDIDTVTIFGYASGPCISPPEIVHSYATVQLTIGIEDIEELIAKAGVGGFDEIEVEDVNTISDKDCWTIKISVAGDEISRTGGLYERIQL